MTLKRKLYLSKCGKWEEALRLWINLERDRIKDSKQRLKEGCDESWEKECLRTRKHYLSMYRHELARLKGVDGIARPQFRGFEYLNNGHKKYFTIKGSCGCGKIVYGINSYCPNCGKRLLWEKLKE